MVAADFLFKTRNFPTIPDADIDEAIIEVEVMFSGALTLWATVNEPLRTEKRKLLENYLVGWYLANTRPLDSVDVQGTGGMPMTSKSIGGTSLSYSDLKADPGIMQLTSNMFGILAIEMIRSTPERLRLIG